MSGREIRTKAGDRVLVDVVRQSPVDRHVLRTRRKILGILLLLIAIVVLWLAFVFLRDSPVAFDSTEMHFKYGSIGSEPGGSPLNPVGGVLPPYWVFKVLPDVCPDLLPGGYQSLGFLFEEGADLPIGVSQRRRLGVEQVGLNCAVCHTGTYRESPASTPQLVLGMPAHGLLLQEFFDFVLSCSLDPRFTPDNVVAKIQDAGGRLGFFDRFIYRSQVIPAVRETSLGLMGRIEILLGEEAARWGAGRVDTFNPYKSIQFNWLLKDLPPEELIGSSDYPSLWNQEPREGMQLHWDGNNPSVAERNLSASLGAGVTPTTIDHAALQRVADWAWTLPAPAYPFPINASLADRGQALYRSYCYECHLDHTFRDGAVPSGTRIGKVEKLSDIGTDPYRLNSYTETFAQNQYTLYPSSTYGFKSFRKTNGYANHPLDGIWLRAPYLHNGSVPTLRYLLEPPESRPSTFYRGYDEIDQQGVGFVYDVAEADGRQFFFYDTALPGNGNQGHVYGTTLPVEDKAAIVEYMKRL